MSNEKKCWAETRNKEGDVRERAETVLARDDIAGCA